MEQNKANYINHFILWEKKHWAMEKKKKETK